MDLVIFVCHGNICRSPMAEFLAKHLDHSNKYQYISRATSLEEIGNDIYYPARVTLEKHSIPYSHREASRITLEEFRNAKHVFTMDYNNVSYLKRLFPYEDFSKVSLLGDKEIEDPWYTGNFEKVYQEIKTSIIHFLSEENI